MDSFRSDWALPQPGFPIQKSADQSSLAAPRSLSQLATSFVGAWCHWHPPCALVRLITIILRPIFFSSSDKIATGLNNLNSRYSRPSNSLCSCQGTWGFRPDGSASLGESLLLEGFLTPWWLPPCGFCLWENFYPFGSAPFSRLSPPGFHPFELLPV